MSTEVEIPGGVTAELPALPGLGVVRMLGHGGMGAVFLAADRSGRTMALKVMAGDAMTDRAARIRFDREVAAVRAVRHRNVVRLLRAGTAEGIPYALFERVRGRSLGHIGAQPWAVVVDLGCQLAHAIAAVHAAGWLHRDIKPANAMVGDHGLVTLIDFGLAKRIDDVDPPGRPHSPRDTSLTVEGTVVGTRRYLAPEILRRRPASTATDVYALGLVLHELLGGSVDAEGRIGASPTVVPAALTAALAEMLDDDPAKRPTAATVADLLETLPAATGLFRAYVRDDACTWPANADQVATCDDRAMRRA